MKEFKYHLSVRDCRAIKSAEIDLSEVTVFTGINASGKSTVARMFRDLVEFSAEYERLLAVQMWNSRMDMWRYALRVVRGRMRTEGVMALARTDVAGGLAKGQYSLADAIELLHRALQEVMSDVGYGNDESFVVQRIRRFLDIDRDDDIMSKFNSEAASTITKYEKRRQRRSYAAYRELLQGNPLTEGQISLTEGGRTVFSNDSNNHEFDGISFIKRAIYIESPFKSIPQSVTATELNMGDRFSRIKEDATPALVERLSELQDVLSGNVDYENEFDEDSVALNALLGRNGRWMYHRSDGESFNLDDCATGIKALSILNILHSRGWLDAETLLIIDEPEAHLHPQWIVEYARLLLLLSCRLRVRILVTSHSPDMVNALHTIGMALGMDKDIGFYLAEKDSEDKFKFNYRGLGNKVGDIFKAYNVSFGKIDAYARNASSK